MQDYILIRVKGFQEEFPEVDAMAEVPAPGGRIAGGLWQAVPPGGHHDGISPVSVVGVEVPDAVEIEFHAASPRCLLLCQFPTGHYDRSTGRVHRIKALPFIANPDPGSGGKACFKHGG